jgi:hypothetical protein
MPSSGIASVRFDAGLERLSGAFELSGEAQRLNRSGLCRFATDGVSVGKPQNRDGRMIRDLRG